MTNYLKRLRSTSVIILSCLFLTGCLGGTTTVVTDGGVITFSPCLKMWGEIDKEELKEPLSYQAGCDILTRQTLEDIINNNEARDD